MAIGYMVEDMHNQREVPIEETSFPALISAYFMRGSGGASLPWLHPVLPQSNEQSAHGLCPGPSTHKHTHRASTVLTE